MNKIRMRYRPIVSKLLRSPKFVRVLVSILYAATISSIGYHFFNNKTNIITAIFVLLFATVAYLLFFALHSYACFQSRQNELSNIRIERSIIRLSNSMHRNITNELHESIRFNSSTIKNSIETELKKIEISTNILTDAQAKHFADAVTSLQDSTRLIRNTMKNLLVEQEKTSTETRSNERTEIVKKLDSLFIDHSFKSLINLQKINSEIILVKHAIEGLEIAQDKQNIND